MSSSAVPVPGEPAPGLPEPGGAPAYHWWFPLRGGPALHRLVMLLCLVAVGGACASASGTTLRSVGASALLIAVIEFGLLGAGLRSARAVAIGIACAARPRSTAVEALLVGVGAVAMIVGGILGSGAYFYLRVGIGDVLLIVGLYPLAAGLIMIIGRRHRQPADPAGPGPAGAA